MPSTSANSIHLYTVVLIKRSGSSATPFLSSSLALSVLSGSATELLSNQFITHIPRTKTRRSQPVPDWSQSASTLVSVSYGRSLSHQHLVDHNYRILPNLHGLTVLHLPHLLDSHELDLLLDLLHPHPHFRSPCGRSPAGCQWSSCAGW